MSTYIGTRDYIDLPEWRPLSVPVFGSTLSLSGGVWMAEDYRNNDYSSGLVYFNTSTAAFNVYYNKTDAWKNITQSFGVGGTFNMGSSSVFVPSLGPKGLLLASNTTTKLNLDGTWNASSAASWTRSGTTLTVTPTTGTSHGYTSGNNFNIYVQAISDPSVISVGTTVSNINVMNASVYYLTCNNAGALSGTITSGIYVNANQYANRGDGKGCIIRVIGCGAGSSGKTEERHIIANTAGVTPTVILDEPLSFTPIAGDKFEILAGSYVTVNTGVLVFNPTQIRRYDVATGQFVGLNNTNLIATVPQSVNNILIAMDEGHVPWNRKCYEGYLIGSAVYDTSNTLTGGMKGCLQATATAAAAITGQASGGDAAVVANQFRNYQIRIVEDTGTPTSVGQRRRISSHTAGPSAVYQTSSNWTVTPSATAKYVIENWTDNIIYLVSGTNTVYNFTHTTLAGSGTRDSWDTTTWAAKPNTSQTAGAMAFHSFGILPDELNSAKASNIFLFRGSSATFDVLDVAGGTSGSWTSATALENGNTTYDSFSNGDSNFYAYNPHSQGGKYLYTYLGSGTTLGTNPRSPIRFDATSFRIEKYSGMRMGTSYTNTNYQSRFAWTSVYHDPTNNTKVAFWNCPRQFSSNEFFQTPLLS